MTTMTQTQSGERAVNTPLPTGLACAQCGGEVYAENQLELRLIRDFPRDGHWLCPTCRPKWGREWGR